MPGDCLALVITKQENKTHIPNHAYPKDSHAVILSINVARVVRKLLPTFGVFLSSIPTRDERAMPRILLQQRSDAKNSVFNVMLVLDVFVFGRPLKPEKQTTVCSQATPFQHESESFGREGNSTHPVLHTPMAGSTFL